MSTHLSRYLEKEEQVDHIDGDKTHDTIENLQILTVSENNKKSVIERGKSSKSIELVCPICGVTFERKPKVVNFKRKQGKIPTCSRKCGTIMANKNRAKKEN